MIGLSLLLAAQAAPNVTLPAARQDCVRAIGSEIAICATPPAQTAGPPQPEQQANYRLPKLGPKAYGPGIPRAQTDLGGGVRATLRGQATNKGGARRTKPVATVGIPF